MSLIRRIIGLQKIQAPLPEQLLGTVYLKDEITKAAGGANLVDGKHTWELAQTHKDDLLTMQRACEAELKTMGITGMVAAPFYFERVAILQRKAKKYQAEVNICEIYIREIDAFYAKHGTDGRVDVRKGPTYEAIVRRLPKAQALLQKLS